MLCPARATDPRPGLCLSRSLTLTEITSARPTFDNMQKFYWNNQQSPYTDKFRTYEVTRDEVWCEDVSRLTLAVNPPDTEHACCVQVTNNEELQVGDTRPALNRVVVRLGDQQDYNRTWNERTKYQYSRAGKSVEPAVFNHHDYENVYDDTEFSIKDQKCVSASARNTPRSRKKKRLEGRVYRSKSCERVTGMLDRLSEKLSINSESPPPPSTPTPSLLQSVAARAIPCVDIKPPCESTMYGGVAGSTEGHKDIFRPAANLADRMRGRMEYVNRKIKIIRSRSAERLRGYIRPEVLQVGGGEDKRSQQVSDRHHLYQYRPDSSLLPVLGKARALVSCTPSPYDIDILRYQAGDIIDIIQMNPNGLWRGRCGDHTGQFKFINVELVPESRRRHRSRGRSLSKMSVAEPANISSISDVLRVLDMSDYLPVFVLNGYEDLTLLKDLDEEELNYLGVTDSRHRKKLMDMAGVLFPHESEGVMT